MKKLIAVVLTLTILSINAYAAKADLKFTSKEAKFIKVAQKYKRLSGQKLTAAELEFIKGFTVGDGSDCDPLVPDCSGCGFWEKYMCEAMILDHLK